MGKVIEINARPTALATPPANLWRLRWRIKVSTGIVVSSAWLPETRYPSIRQTLIEFAGMIDAVHVDGINLKTGEKMTFLSCPGDVFASVSYKGMMNAATGIGFTAGIEVEDRDGNRHLVLRDGTVYVEERTANVSNND